MSILRTLSLGLLLGAAPSFAAELSLPKDLQGWAAPSFLAARIELQGAEHLPQAEQRKLLAPYEGRLLTMAEVQALQDALMAAYAEAGYVQAQVLLPDQRLGEGTLRFQIYEGVLGQITVTTDGRLDPAYVQGRLAKVLKGPLRLSTLQQALVRAQEDSRIRRLDAALEPGSRPGEGRLRVSVEEAPPWQLGLSMDNHRPESIGAESGRLSLRHQNLSGAGDVLALSLAVSEGSDAGALSYRRPLNAADAALSLYASRDEAQVLEAPFSVLDIESQTDRYGLKLEAPLLDGLRTQVSASIAVERRRTITKLLGDRFSLAPGAVNGEAGVNAVVLAVDSVHRGGEAVWALRGALRRGLRGPGTTEPAPGTLIEADGAFLLTLLQGQYERRLGDLWSLKARGMLQLSRDALLAAEKLSLGGAGTVRGYRENLLVRDNGAGLSLELARRLGKADQAAWLRALQLIAFVDLGVSWDERNASPNSTVKDTRRRAQIVGSGFGLRWSSRRGLGAELFYGYDLIDNFTPGEDPRDGTNSVGLQNQGVHFQLRYERSF